MESGMSENDNSAMTLLMRKFRRLARLGAGVLVLHHRPKNGEAAYRGGTGIPANTDMAISADKTDEGIVELREIRFRGCAKWEIDFRVHFSETSYSYDVIRESYTHQAIKEEKQANEGALLEIIEENVDANDGKGPTQSELQELAKAQGISRRAFQKELPNLVQRKLVVVKTGERGAIYYRRPTRLFVVQAEEKTA
jgi:hypothetical protein